MKIFLTGATGFVGAHTALMLLESGHELRLLVRNKEFARQYFAGHGYDLDDFVEADMRDKTVLQTTMPGCDAVLHAAAMVSLNPAKADEVYNNNIESISAVVGTACDLGIKNIVYVSSLGALFNPNADCITESSPLGVSKEAYSRSKRDCEAYVRNLQQQGSPIQITYPSGIFGPDDPKLSESNHALITLLKIIPRTTSGLQFVDVRDLAKAHVSLLENPPRQDYQQARYIVGGHFYPWSEFHQLLESVINKKIQSPPVPGNVLRLFGLIMDMIKKVYPVDIPVSSESMAIVTQWPAADSSKAEQALGLCFRPPEQTFSDTIRWLIEAGHIDKKIFKTGDFGNQ